MLMTALANRYAHQLLDARQKSELMPSLASRYPITVEDAYELRNGLAIYEPPKVKP